MMKTIAMSLVGALVLVGSILGVKAICAHPIDEQAVKNAPVEQSNEQNPIANEGEVSQFQEISHLEEIVDLSKYQIEVVEDLTKKRILLLLDEKGHPAYKSIFIKRKNIHKVIDLNGERDFVETLADK